MNAKAKGTDSEALTTLRDGIRMRRVFALETMSVDYVEVDPGACEFLIVHHECDEAWYMLGGQIEAICGTETRIAREGDWVLVPRGMPHGSQNHSDEIARLLVVNSPPWEPEFDHDARDQLSLDEARDTNRS